MNGHVKAEQFGASELSDAELGQVQGGGVLGDAWNWVKDKASDAADAVVHAVTHPLDTLDQIASIVAWLQRNYPRQDTRNPYPGGY